MAEAKTANASFRRTWDESAFREKAAEKDREEKERMQAKEEATRKGKKPRKGGPKEVIPKPTELMKQREGSLELDKNLNKTMIVTSMSTGRRGVGPGQPGYYCEICNRNCKDSIGYLDHLNGRTHLRRLGQTTTIARSTLEQVRARIAIMREKTREVTTAKNFDFEKRLAEVRAKEEAIRTEKKLEKQKAKDGIRAAIVLDEAGQAEQDQMAAMMGFGGFGSTKK